MVSDYKSDSAITLDYKSSVTKEFANLQTKELKYDEHKLLLLLLCLCGYGMAYPQLVRVSEGYSNTSVNTTVFRNSPLVTDGDTQYISYYDPEGYLVLGKRQIGSAEWTLKRSV